MTILIIENGVVVNRIVAASVAQAQALFPNAVVAADPTDRYAKGDAYP